MRKSKEKANKIKTSKGEIAIRIMGIILAILMVISVCVPCVYYVIDLI